MSDGVELAFPAAARSAGFADCLASLAARARQAERATFRERISALGLLSDTLLARRQELATRLPGVGLAFLVGFLRSEHLLETLAREIPQLEALEGFVRVAERKSLRIFPRGLVGHWIAGNVPLLGMFSWAVSAALGNANVLRLSTRQDDLISPLVALLAEVSPAGRQMADETAIVVFDRDNLSAHQRMSQAVDVRIAWGGSEAIEAIRGLPASWHTDDIALGPRMSLAVIDPARMSPAAIERLAVDAVYFDQLACSSPQRVFVRGRPGDEAFDQFVERFTVAFGRQAAANRRHPLDFSETYQIHLDRTRMLLAGGQVAHDRATQWTVALVEAPLAEVVCANRVIQVIAFEDFAKVYAGIPENVQTVITALDPDDFADFTEAAGHLGVCRFPHPGEGNHFEVPWDGIPLASRLTRWVLRTDS